MSAATESRSFFVGHNELILNEATMKIAVQLWLETIIDARQVPEVTAVMPTKDGVCSGQTFKVLLKDKQL